MIDFGITYAIARLLIDYKDRRDGGDYGSLLQTGWLVLAIQAVVILCLGIGLSPHIESGLGSHPSFTSILRS